MKTRRFSGPLSLAFSLALCAAAFTPSPARGGESAESAKAQSGITFGESVNPRAKRQAPVSALARAARTALKAKAALSPASAADVGKMSQDVPFGDENDQIQNKRGYFNACGRDIAEGFKSGAKEGAVAVGTLGLIVGAVIGSGGGPLGTVGGAVAGAAAGGLLGGLSVGAAGALGSALICANDYIHTR